MILPVLTFTCSDPKPAQPLDFEKFMGPISSIRFPVNGYRDELVMCEHLDSGSKIVFGERKEDTLCGKGSCCYGDKKSPKILQVSKGPKFSSIERMIKGEEADVPADQNRKIAEIGWHNVYNASTTGPILTIRPEMDCRIKQPRDMQSLRKMLMKCRPVDAPRGSQDHTFIFTKVGTSKHSKILSGTYITREAEKVSQYFYLRDLREFSKAESAKLWWPSDQRLHEPEDF